MATEFFSAADLEKIIGYTFHDKAILEEARTREAYCNEKPSEGRRPMDALATLGDAVLDTVAILQIYESKKCTSQELTEDKIKQVRREKTAAFAKDNNLHKYILWGNGESHQKIWENEYPCDTITEAIIGAIFFDVQKQGQNGLIVVQDFLKRKKFFQPSAVK